MSNPAETPAPAPSDFIRDVVAGDVQAGKYDKIVTRFPPEPNGYLHIGHAKSICLNFGIAREFGGVCHLRMDDTNPTKEDVEYVDSITADVQWLIGGWADHCLGLKPKGATPATQTVNGKPDFHLGAVPVGTPGVEPFYASDYFEQIHAYAVQLIQLGKAFVCDLSAEEIDELRRNGKPSPFRGRSIEENLDLFARMKAGEFPDGARTLRAKIDVAAPNIWLRDPLLYRIRHVEHHHTGAAWRIYPMYDFAHCLSDYIEGVTHSICTLEFEVHRPLYDWILEALNLPRPLPHQFEFARLNLTYMVMSKRKLMQLVDDGLVTGWDDPRMPTISGIRRRGVPAVALRDFAYNIGITKYDGLTEIGALDHAIRSYLNEHALRRFAVLRPIKIVLTNLPDNHFEELDAFNLPNAPEDTRRVPFTKELFIDADDFMEIPPPKYFRLRPGGEVRLKYGYIIQCDEVVKNEAGEIVELRCTVDLTTKRGGPNGDRKVKGTIHWVSASHSVDAEVRLYDRLFTVPEPDAEGGDFKKFLNPHSYEVVTAKCEPSLASASPDERYQFERLAYFSLDPESAPEKLVFNRTITLKDTWAKEAQKK
jgi:glutaminyl-tRNA synthetase